MEPQHRTGDYLSRYARLFAIDAQIRAGGKPSHASLARDLGVSTRTIQRDFDYLGLSLHAPLAYDANARGWFYQDATFFLPQLLATADDLLALLLIRQAIEQYAGTPYAAAARRAFEIIEKALPEHERSGAEWVKQRVAFTDFPPPDIAEAVWRAVYSRERVAHAQEAIRPPACFSLISG